MKRRNKYLVHKVQNHTLKYGKKYGVTLKEAQNAYITGFMGQARKHRKKYGTLKGIAFEFY